MAVPSVAFDGTRISGAESESDSGTWDKWGATQSPVQEDNFVYSGSYSISNKISNTTGGIDFDATTARDYSTTRHWLLAKVLVTTSGAIDVTVVKGAAYQIGSSGSDYYDYYIFGSANLYPAKGGWQILAIDPVEAGYRDATVGTPVLTTVDYYGWWADILGLVKAENICHDALEWMANGDGLTLTVGDATTPGTFQDFVDADEGTSTARWGVVTTVQGAIVVTGYLNIGLGAAAYFDDSNRVVLWADGRCDSGWAGLELNLNYAATDITIAGCFFESKGHYAPNDYFNPSTDIDETNSLLALEDGWGWSDYDYVQYRKNNGSAAIGLTDLSYYWIAYDSTNDGWAFYSTRADALADTARIELAAGASENQYISSAVDTRAKFECLGTTSTAGAEVSDSTFGNFNVLLLTSKVTLLRCKFIQCSLMTHSDAVVTDCTFDRPKRLNNQAAINTDDPTNITGCRFICWGASGHAIRITTAGTYTLDGNTFEGYGANGTSYAAIRNDSGGVVTLNITGGVASPTYYNGTGTSTVINNNTTVKLSGVVNDTEVRVYEAGTTTVVDGIEDVVGNAWSFSAPAADFVDIRIHHVGYKYKTILNYEIPAETTTIPIEQEFDRDYSNPAE